MQTVLIVARLLHIVTAAYWMGAMLFVNFLLGPSMAGAGPSGLLVLRELLKRKFHAVTVVTASIAILSGLYLVWHDSAHFDPGWFRSAFGQAISTGMLLAIIAYVLGVFWIGPVVHRMAELGAQAAAMPTPALLAELGATRMRLIKLGVPNSLLLLLAASAMAVARYL